MKNKLMDYIVYIERSLSPEVNPGAKEIPLIPRPELQVIPDKDGYPQLPAAPDTALNHEELVMVVRAFLNTHYRMFLP
jgi:hypothetical protein